MNDSQFNIKIKDYRAISEADIDINGITVLSGVNGCGKSSISLLVYEYLNSSIQLESLLVNKIAQLFHEPLILMEDILDDVLKGYDENTYNKNKDEIKLFYSKWNNNQINKDELTFELLPIILNIKEFYNDFEDKIISNENQKLKISRITKLINNYLPYNYSGADFDDILRALNSFLFTEIDKLKDSGSDFPSLIITDRLKKLYKNNTLPKRLDIKEFGVLLYSLTTSNQAREVHSLKNIFYIDSPLILEAESEALLSNNHWKHLRDSIKKQNEFDSKLNIDNLFQDNIHIKNIEHTITFEESFNYIRTDGKSFNLTNSATGIKSFALLNLLYRNGLLTKNTLLLLDEPEVHLHPQWVVEYARLVVLLNKHLGVKFLIASHHPEFVSSIKYISEKENTTNGLNFYVAEEVGKFSFKYKSTGTEIEDTFDSFNKSFDLIDEYGDNEI